MKPGTLVVSIIASAALLGGCVRIENGRVYRY
jgi:hypothetical protein